MTLALLLAAVGGAWAQSTPKVYTTQVTVDDLQVGDILAQGFSLVNKESEKGFYFDKNRHKLNGGSISDSDWHDLISDITSYGENCTISIRSTGHPDNVFTPVDENGNDGNAWVVTKIDNGKPYISGITFEITEWDLTSQDGKAWTLAKMPASGIELQVEYFAESNLFLGKEALADKANIAVKNGETAVAFDDAGKSTTTVSEGNKVTATYSGTRKVKSVKAVKKGGAAGIVNPVVGQFIGSDGKNYDANATLPDGVTAVAMIAYVGNDAETSTTYNHGLALALSDADTKTWCSQTDATCLGTQYDSNKFEDLAGIANTDALVNHTGHTHDAANAARGYNSGTHPTGTSAWFLPSAGQWDKMATAAIGILKTNAGLQGNYWSSTERTARGAWYFDSGGSGSWASSYKYDGRLVRACLAFDIAEWDLTSEDGKTWTLDKMPGSDIELQVEYYAESNLFLGKEALADKANIAVKNGETAVAFDDEGKSTTTVSEGNTVTATYTGTKKVIGMTVTKRKRPEFVPGATIQNLESFVEVENNRDGTITLHMPTLNPSTYNVTNSTISNGENTLHFGYEIGSGENMSVIGANVIAKSWSDHTPFSELDKTIDITSGKPRVAIIITGHPQSATCPAPERELYWGLYRYTNPVKVTYNLGGGSVSGSTADKVEYLFSGDALATTFAAPTREGHTFDGWYTSAEGGTKLTASNATSATTIYAHWNAIAE